ncbi:hypothetical protein JTE90_010886 [Oedothorax gibbosus]|uniref:Uncharacterized protein n=1 Tax=Oedothorax gibbosus TaxID=931172 RepID=A0AAV6U223_9ARAC|nr:hypothetical protein JTE90_010886 [Oedothorax gibbosus]
MEDNQSDGEAPVEAEVRDIRSCIQAMESKLRDIEDCFRSLRGELQCISELAQQQENMRMEAEDETETATAYAAVDQLLTTEKLSQNAISLLDRTDLKFRGFLLDKSFGKPKPSVLPIARSYTPTGSADNIYELVNDLEEFVRCLRQHHNQYKEERRKDVNLENRIKRLVGNLHKELEQEAREGKRQTSMESYTYVTMN